VLQEVTVPVTRNNSPNLDEVKKTQKKNEAKLPTIGVINNLS